MFKAFKKSLGGPESSFLTNTIQEEGIEHTPALIKKLGCIAPIFTTAAGTASLIKGALTVGNFENAYIYLAIGIGLLAFNLIYPIKRILKK